MNDNHLLKTLTGLRGNPRACVFTEPLWGVSMNLCLPYASVFMLALGLRDAEIGFITTAYMATQVIFGLLGGVITDKLGRRKTTAIFDFIAWCIPCLFWMNAQGFWFFLVAALFNGTMRVTTNSWDCLLVEDAEKSQVTRIYSLVVVSGQLSALFAPVASILVSRLTLVPAIRILYINAFIVMTAKIILLYCFSRETRTGIVRMHETNGESFFKLLAGYGGIFRIIKKSKGMGFSLTIAALAAIVGMVNTTFWQVIASKRILVPDPMLPLFPMFRSLLAIAFLFLITPRLLRLNLRTPLLFGFASYIAGQTILALTPAEGPLRYVILCVSLVFDAFGLGTLMMLAESLVALHVDKAERARAMAIQHMIIMLSSTPFGWIAGILSGINRVFPFLMNLFFLAAGLTLTLIYYRLNPRDAYAGHEGEYLPDEAGSS